MDPLMFLDDSRLFKEWMYLQTNATILESMLVALAHMQVNFVYLRDFKDRRTGLTAFRKNVISFPQEALELQDLKNFFSSVEINDIVNVYWQPAEDVPKTLHRARVFQIMQHGFRVQIEYHEKMHTVDIPTEDVEKRVSLPWKPKDLRNHLIVFRRK